MKPGRRHAGNSNTTEKLGFDVAVETGAGHLASFDDNAYREAGADIVSTQEAWQSDLIFKVNAPQDDEIPLMKAGSSLVSFIWPAQNPQLLENCQHRVLTSSRWILYRVSHAPSRWMH